MKQVVRLINLYPDNFMPEQDIVVPDTSNTNQTKPKMKLLVRNFS